jgi:hypothetical protein
VHPRLLPAAFGDRGHPCIFVQRSRGGIAFPLCTKGDEEARSEDWPRPWEGWEEGEVGMALGPLRDGRVEVRDGLQGDPKLGHQYSNQQGIGSDDSLSGGQRRGALDGLDTLRDDVCRAPVVGTAEGLKRGAPRALGGFQGRPAAQKVTDKEGILVLKPLQYLREIVFSGAGEAVGHAHFIPDHATTVGDEWCAGTHGEALGLERLELVPMRAE